MVERVEIGDAVLWHGDCREILPTLTGIDACITDPPYGVEFSGKSGHYRNKPRAKKDETYASYNDGSTEFDAVVVPAINAARAVAKCALVFMGSKSLLKLPSDGEVGGIFMPNGCGLTSWGFQNFMHCVFYGSDPYLSNRLGSKPNGKYGLHGNDANKIDHPCAKPIAAMEWAVARASLPRQTVVDPFMGSGTTGVACAKLGRRFVGIEVHRRYFDLACRRIEEAYKQADLFVPAPTPKPVQQALFGGEAA